MESTEYLSLKRKIHIDYLKAFAIILVVLGHSISVYCSSTVPSETTKIVLSLITSVHVPLFFVLAGYLCHRQNLKVYYKKKCYRIIMPFITFSTLKIIYSYYLSNKYMHGTSIKESLIDGVLYGNFYWFSYCIFIIYTLAPIFWTRENKQKSLIKQIIIFILVIIVNTVIRDYYQIERITNIFQLDKVLYFLPFFLAGMFFSTTEEKIKEKFTNKRIVLVSLAGSILFILIYMMHIGIWNFMYVVRVILALALMYFLYIIAKGIKIKNGILESIAKYSYQIMLFDSFFKVILYYVFSKMVGITLWWAIIIAVIDICVSVISCIIIEKIPYVKWLFGLKN